MLFLSSNVVLAATTDDIDISIPNDLDVILEASRPSKHIFGGYVKNETAYRFDEPRSFTKIRNILSVNWLYLLFPKVKLYSSGWGYYDHVYDLFNYDTIAARDVRNEKEPLVFIDQLNKGKR
jgi:hypothetical protein